MPIYDILYNYALKQKEIVEDRINNLENILNKIEPKNLVDKDIANSIMDWLVGSLDRDLHLVENIYELNDLEFIPEPDPTGMIYVSKYCIVDHQDNSIRVCDLDSIIFQTASLAAISYFFKPVIKILKRYISKGYLDEQVESTKDLDIDSYTKYTVYPSNLIKVNNYQKYSGLGNIPNVIGFSTRNTLVNEECYVFKERLGYETDYFTYMNCSEPVYMTENFERKIELCTYCILPPAPKRGTPYEFGDLIALGVTKFVEKTEGLIYVSKIYKNVEEVVVSYYLLKKVSIDLFGDYIITKKNCLRIPAKLVKYFSNLHKMFGLTEKKVTILDLNTISTPDKQLSLIQKCKELYGEPDEVINQVMNYVQDK